MPGYSLNNDFDLIRDEWLELVDRPGAPLEYAPDWILATAQSAGVLDEVSVFCQERDGKRISFTPILPGTFSAFGLSCRSWEAPGMRLVANHSVLLSETSELECLTALVDSLPESADLLIVPSIVEGSKTEQAIRDFCAASGWKLDTFPAEGSPYLTIDCSWDEFLASKSRNFRYTLKRKEKSLAKKGAISEQWFHSPESVDELIDAVLAVEAKSWKVDAGMAISERGVEERYYRLLLPFLAAQEALAANVLYLDDAPVAYSLCYAWHGQLAQLKTSFVEDISRLSPGLVVNHRSIRYAFENGFSEFDFLGDVMPHKMHWTDDVRYHSNYYLYAPKLKARCVHLLKTLIARLRGGRQREETQGRSARKTDS